MKKLFLALLLLIAPFVMAQAQSMQEVVYLKNGSIIRGVIVEQLPGVSLKIMTGDGSIFAYNISDVEKITKEVSKTNNSNPFSLDKGNDLGYKGLFDFGYSFGVGDYGVDRFEIATSHGYQWNPYAYVGAGIGLNYYSDASSFAIPVFVNSRFYFLNSGISPYFDAKVGYSFGDIEGFYVAPSFGCKIGCFNLSVGYTMQMAEFVWYDPYYYYGSTTENCSAITLKMGFEF